MKKRVKLFAGTCGGTLISLSSVGAAFAFSLRPPRGYNQLTRLTPQSVVSGVIQILLLVTFIIAFVFLIIGGVRWILSGGDKAAAESARGTLTAALIGLVIVLAAWGIIVLIELMFNIKIISSNLDVPRLY